MNVFEIILSDTSIEHTVVDDYQVEPWKLIFETEDLSTLFDMTPAAEAIAVIDAAVARLTANSELIRHVITSQEKLGVRGYRTRLLAMRRDLANYPGARMSGVLEV
ncbi:hypothetical protein ACFU44_00300 [Nocardia rhizosphaerihabitans]|uniref:hypothetical protein n=1 Tax=Nocardia rhizosphaerihabitans TaxID=1691570 RepID=UPI0036709FB8